MKNRNPETLKILGSFVVFYLLNAILLNLPFAYPETKISNGNWNWPGKLYAVLGSLIFLSIYRKFPLSDYFLTFKQEKKFIYTGVGIIVLLLLIHCVYAYLSPVKKFDLETLLFQFSMPGIDEEIAYRGIMLGLLLKVLKSKNIFLNPAIWTTSLLFGMAHGLFITENFELVFHLIPFLWASCYGLILGWITIKSGSILFALISHNLGNGVGMLIKMQ
ncbi:CPBP family intramembrane metalloprotease [Algoriphagus sp. AGSA1]|uniref:CPBP family intramembrane glutamic endopeptidase n=1 Tax=Algoriphagus sp. AGSA1 TaxID=2907213 RepID=UPI001F42529C|nr:CPBP family intramembrane glutamic endopeptidase [Algoriphagus sp. AGSA1]MCE7053203.1 CPBP family intramembrane metalloprotease [Algoriphagus sp. AGSA1]